MRKKMKSFLGQGIGILIALLFVSPVLLVFFNAFKPLGDILKSPFSFPDTFYKDGIRYVWENMNYPRVLGNTVFVAVVIVAVTVLLSAMCGYKLSRTNDKKSKFFMVFLMASMMIPFQSIMLPVSKVASALHLSDSLLGYIIVTIPLYAPFAVFMFHGFVKNIPRSIEEAARIDGCSPFRMFFQIVFPLMSTVTASIVVLFSLWVWNDYLLPSILLRSEENKTLTVSIYSFFSAQYTRWDYGLASLCLSIIPITIFFLFMQKYFIAGITAGAVKE